MKRSLYIYIITFFLVSITGGTFSETLYHSPQWWNTQWRYRVIVNLSDLTFENKKAAVAYVKLHTYGNCNSDVSDVRVTDSNGNAIPFKVMFYHENLYCIIAFEIQSKIDTYLIYYGNPRASKKSQRWEPRAGLFLETRRREGGTASNLRKMYQIIKASKIPFGAEYRTNGIFDGFNPFGPSTNYISIYTGYVNCPLDGSYWFCTASDDASFVLIDGKLVAEWPRIHNAKKGVYGKFGGRIRLKKGVHRIEYLHTQHGADQACVAGWQLPGFPHPTLLPPKSFVPIRKTKIARHEEYQKKVKPDFEIVYLSGLNIQDNHYSMLKLIDKTKPIQGDVISRTWDFGDGITDKEYAPSHLYLSDGTYTVSLNVTTNRGDKATSSLTFPVYANEYITPKDPIELAEKAFKTLSTYDFSKMKPSDQLAAMGLYLYRDRYKEAAELGKQVVLSGTELDSGRRMSSLLKTVEIYNHHLNEPDESLALLKEAAARSNKATKQQARIILALGETYLYVKNDPETALPYFEKIDRPQMPEFIRRKAFIGFGDCHRFKGDYQKALEYYTAAEKMSSDKGKSAALYESSYGLTVEHYINNNKFEDALEIIAEWEETYPTAKLDGYLSYLKSLCYKNDAEKRDDGILEIETLLSVNPGTTRLADILRLLGTLYALEKNYQKAIDTYQRLLDTFQDLPDKTSIETRIKRYRNRLK